MSGSTKPAWERISDAMLDWCGYVLLALATALGLIGGDANGAWRVTTLAIAAAAAGWIYVLYTRLPQPKNQHRLRSRIFFAGLLALASILMLRHPVFFIFMISGFFYASSLRPLPLAVVGVAMTSILVNTLIAGLPTTPDAWMFYLAIIGVQTVAIGFGSVIGEKLAELSEERREAVARLETALEENAGLHAQLLTQAREAGMLDERARMAREIHDTIAQGLTGIVTQLEAADQTADRPTDQLRHLDTAKRLARDSLEEARRSLEASRPRQLVGQTLPVALDEIASRWSSEHGVPVEVSITGDATPLNPEIESALLRVAQESLANVARHAGASRARLTLSYMGDVVTLDIRDDGVGFVPPNPANARRQGFGLTGMRQRVSRVAGTLAIESEPGGGTAISARVPAIAAPLARVP